MSNENKFFEKFLDSYVSYGGGGFQRLSLSFFSASLMLFSIFSGLLSMGILQLLVYVIYPDQHTKILELELFFVAFIANLFDIVKPFILGLFYMLLFAWLGWIFAGFAKNE